MLAAVSVVNFIQPQSCSHNSFKNYSFILMKAMVRCGSYCKIQGYIEKKNVEKYYDLKAGVQLFMHEEGTMPLKFSDDYCISDIVSFIDVIYNLNYLNVPF
jgi:hypothetical protein